MLSRRAIVSIARASRVPLLRPSLLLHPRLPIALQQLRSYADTIVKVPQMAESISEGTLKQWSKQIGDYVEQDEEIATIETDKVGGSAVINPVFAETYGSVGSNSTSHRSTSP